MAAEENSDSAKRIRAVTIKTRDVFSAEKAAKRPFYRLLNALHVPTREAVVKRELWFGAGDLVEPWEVQELERHLRDMGLFGEVDVSLTDSGHPEGEELQIRTRDRFSLNSGAGGFFVGGVSGVSGSLGDSNLFGTGNRLGVRYSKNSDDEESGSISFTDTQFLDSWASLRVSGGFTDEGSDSSISLWKPFQHLRDSRAWNVSASQEESEVDYFLGGDTFAEVPRESESVHLAYRFGEGGATHQSTSGIDLRFVRQDFGAATGMGAAGIAVPGDLTRLDLGWIGSFRREFDHLKRTGIDSIDYVEDIPMGARYEWYLGAAQREEEGAADALEPLALVGYREALAAGDAGLVTLSLSGQSRWRSGSVVGWSANGAVHAYHQGSPAQTWALNVDFAQAFEGEDLPTQLTLGEDNGLRGYPAREFQGTRRLRFNLENRIRTDMRVRSIRLGLVPFFDAGWIGEDSLGSARTSVGLGLRLGSTEIFGSGVIRIDLAFPLDEHLGERFDPSLSVSLGQVFSIFGNSSALRGQ